MIFGQLPDGGQFVFDAENHSFSQPMALRFSGSAPILPQSSFRYPPFMVWGGLLRNQCAPR
jgi:hypothetical protein